MRSGFVRKVIGDRTGAVGAGLALGLMVLAGGVAAYEGFAASSDYVVRMVLPASTTVRLAQVEPARTIDPVIAAAPSVPPTEAPPTQAAVPPAKVAGMIPLRYSLAGGASAADAIEVEKPVSVGGTDAGRIALRIDGNARIYALGSRLAAIIAAQSGEAAVPEGLSPDFVSLDALRALGIAVRYDATRDRLVLDPPAA